MKIARCYGMKVKELIEKLKEQDQELEVCTMMEDTTAGEMIYFDVCSVDRYSQITYEHRDGVTTADVILFA